MSSVNDLGRATDAQFMRDLKQANADGRRTPDFFIVGHAKCGTTAMHRMLQAHEQIFLSEPKEPQFLSRDPTHRATTPYRTRRQPQTLDAYLGLFESAAAGQIVGEGSTEYLRTPAAADHIAALNPEARIIAIFREPASFVRSLHLQLLQRNVETESDLATAIKLEQDRSDGRQIPNSCRWPPSLRYSEHVRYAEQLDRYHRHFGRDRVLTLIYDDFRADNALVLRRILDFLGVDSALPVISVESNPTVRARSRSLHRLAHQTAIGSRPGLVTVRNTVKRVTSERFRRRAFQTLNRVLVEREPDASSDDQVLRQLRVRYKPEVIALSEYLNRDLARLWGY